MMTCAWLLRHPILPEQAAALGAYRVVEVPQPPGRFLDAREVWQEAAIACGGRPDLLVMMAPKRMWWHVVALAQRQRVTVVKAIMLDDDVTWSGEWREVYMREGRVQWRPWVPQEVVGS